MFSKISKSEQMLWKVTVNDYDVSLSIDQPVKFGVEKVCIKFRVKHKNIDSYITWVVIAHDSVPVDIDKEEYYKTIESLKSVLVRNVSYDLFRVLSTDLNSLSDIKEESFAGFLRSLIKYRVTNAII